MKALISISVVASIMALGELALACGFPVVEPPAQRPLDACRDGVTVVGPVRVERPKGAPAQASFPFALAAGSATCVTVVSGSSDGQHRVASASIYVDGALVIGPERFSENVTTIEARQTIGAGGHNLDVQLASVPGAFVDVIVTAGGSIDRQDLVQGNYLELFNLFAEPTPFSPAASPVAMRAQGTVLRLEGLPSGQFTFFVRWAFEVRSGACDVVRRLTGETAISSLATFTALTTWNGANEQGALVADGSYTYRFTARFVQVGPGGERVIEELTTAAQPLVLDATAPTLDILSPIAGSFLASSDVPVLVSMADEFTGIEPSSVYVFVDGSDRSGDLTVTPTEVSGTIHLSDGPHTVVAQASDKAGNVGVSQPAAFTVDTQPPEVEILSPRFGDVLSVPEVVVSGTVSDLTLVTIQVNGVDALVSSGAFVAGPLPLVPGANEIVMVATDAAGNQSTRSVAVAFSLSDVGGLIGPDGGRVETTDPASPFFGAYVEIPPGGVTGPTVITIDGDKTGTTCPGAGVSPALQVDSNGSFVGAVTVCVPYDPVAVAFVGGAELEVRLYSTHETGTCSLVRDSDVDIARHIVCSQVAGFSVLQAVVDNAASELRLYGIASAPETNESPCRSTP